MLALGVMPPAPAQRLPSASGGTAQLTGGQVNPPDIQGHWAEQCLKQVIHQDIIKPLPDGSFRPYLTMNRGEFADALRKAFPDMPLVRIYNDEEFVDIPQGYWATLDIEYAYRANFMSGYPDRSFQPTEPISRLEVILAIASGLEGTPPVLPAARFPTVVNPPLGVELAPLPLSEPERFGPPTGLRSLFADAGLVPLYAQGAVGLAVAQGLVVNFPEPAVLRPNEPATRGDVAAFLCQATGSPGLVPPAYQVRSQPQPLPAAPPRFFPTAPF